MRFFFKFHSHALFEGHTYSEISFINHLPWNRKLQDLKGGSKRENI